MKTIGRLIVFIVLISFLAPRTFAQEEEKDFRFTVKTNPIAALGGPMWFIIVPITGEYRVLFEAKTLPKQSIQVGASYLGPSLLINLDKISANADSIEISGIKTSGFRGQLMYKFFLSRDLSAPEGFYVGPHLSYATATIVNKDDEADKVKATKININGIIGYQLITDGGFTLDIYTGLGFRIKKWDYPAAIDTDFDFGTSRNSPMVAFGLNFGYAF
jgi:putative cell wall-binding protein